MANIFQKIFLSKNTCILIDTIKQNHIESETTENSSFTATTVTYKIVANPMEIVSTMRWDNSQGIDYSLVMLNGLQQPAMAVPQSQEYAKSIFLRMRRQYYNQRHQGK